ncbi:Uncharacterized protein dnm_072820 [Desulfonema magnum]|uniref:Uncharacterized protein n=1 Tax=Desulfonema magnum TaxID=45655 RepID=A0A975BTL8_9BACT|nr:Uncharacterized protein dnm_072820 [Desulfonema magnum]
MRYCETLSDFENYLIVLLILRNIRAGRILKNKRKSCLMKHRRRTRASTVR